MRAVAVAVTALALLVSCNRDPNVAKKRYVEMGDTYFKREQYKQAALLYRNAIQKDALYGIAHYKLAMTQLKLGQPNPALGELRRAIDTLPAGSAERTDAKIKLADIYVFAAAQDARFLPEVQTVADELLKKDPKSFDGQRLQASINYINALQAYRAGHADTSTEQLRLAIDHFRQADAAKPGETGIRLALAEALRGDRQFAEAEKIYVELIAKDKKIAQPYLQLYQLYMIQGKPGDAESILKQAIANNPKEYGYLTLLARHYYGMKRRDDMVKVLDQIKSHSKEFVDAYITVGDFYYRLGDPDEALRQFKEGMVADSKRKALYQKHMIEVLMHQGKREAAAELNNDVLKDNPKDSDSRGLQATLLLDKGEVQKAMTELQSVVGSAPDNFVAQFNLGRAHAQRGEYEQARQRFSETIRLRPDYIPARLELAKLQAAHGDYETAIKSAAEIMQFDRGNAQARLIQSASLMGLKKYADARVLLDAMLKVDPNFTDALFQLGVLNMAESKYSDAISCFHKAYTLEPANPRGLMGEVEVYMAEHKDDQAIQVLQAEIQKYPNRADYHVALGNTAVRVGKYDLAISEFQKTIAAVDPNSRAAGDLYHRIGETCRRKGDLNGAIANLQKARSLMPDNTMVVIALALTLDQANRKQEARLGYEQVLKLDPRNGVALNNLAFLMAENNGDLDQALTYAQRAKQLLPQLYEISDTLGEIYLKKALTDNAIEAFKEIVDKQPTHSTYRYHLGMAYAQKGDRMKAIQELNGALKNNPPKEEADKIRQLLAKLG